MVGFQNKKWKEGGMGGGSAKNFMFDRKTRPADCKTREEMFEQDYFSFYLPATLIFFFA